MKNFKFLLTLWFISIAAATFGEVQPKWKATFKDNVIWQKVTSLGNLIVCTHGALYGIDTETGKTIWEKSEYGGLSSSAYAPVEKSPVFSINDGKSITLIDPFEGKALFSSSKAGIDEIVSSHFLHKSGGILIVGKRGNEPVLVMADMANGNVLWKNEEKRDV